MTQRLTAKEGGRYGGARDQLPGSSAELDDRTLLLVQGTSSLFVREQVGIIDSHRSRMQRRPDGSRFRKDRDPTLSARPPDCRIGGTLQQSARVENLDVARTVHDQRRSLHQQQPGDTAGARSLRQRAEGPRRCLQFVSCLCRTYAWMHEGADLVSDTVLRAFS